MLLTVEMVDVRRVGDRVVLSINLDDFSTLKEHGSEYRLLIGYQWRLHVSKTYTWLYGRAPSSSRT